jgi:predicted dehydrogenase
MARKIRLGFVGANVRSHWASESHFPALRAHPDVELTAVCTRSAASAEEARKTLGARLAFSDYREMVASPEIDAVLVVVRVPSHYEPTKAAIEAGKHVYTEWPLAVTTGEAEELAALARAKGVQTATGLQSRVAPEMRYMKELIETGYVGEVLACHVTTMRPGPLERPMSRTWNGDASLGANPLTIQAAHVIDALRFVVGDFSQILSMVTTQARQWYATDTRKMVDVTSPDNVLLNCQLKRGAVASFHVGNVPWAPSGYRMEIYGREGTLIANHKVSSQHGNVRVQGAQRGNELQDLAIPERYAHVPADFPRGAAYNVGQMYALFAQAIRTGHSPNLLPTFDMALEMHHLLDSIRQASQTQRMVAVATRGTGEAAS